MRFLLWNIARATPAESLRPQEQLTDVRIVLERGPATYSFEWMVMPTTRRKRLTKKQLHELEMKVTKHVDTLNLIPSATPVKSIVFARL